MLDENVYPVSIEENGKSYNVENEAGKGFLNEAQKGSLKIVKTSSDGKVEGFSFRQFSIFVCIRVNLEYRTRELVVWIIFIYFRQSDIAFRLSCQR